MDENLRSTKNTKAVERDIRRAFRHWKRRRYFESFYEHGGWYVRLPLVDNDSEDETYTVVDANTDSGFDFERLV
jgi:hypothetical protein